jgi:hypothetical protein
LARVRFSTITDNDAPAGIGSGVASHGDSDTRTEVTSTIIAGNEHSDVDYVNGGANSFDSLGHNLVGGGNATQSPLNAFNQTGDQVGGNPMLGPLANNGGPTRTHALLAGSPAINSGDMNAMAGAGDVPSFDQRGAPFSRVAGGRIDKGAHEAQPIPPAVFGDYNEDGFVNAADYTVWRNMSGQTGVTPFSGADGDGDGMITSEDYDVWKLHYGETLPPMGSGAGVFNAEDIPQAVAIATAAASIRHLANDGTQSTPAVAEPVAPTLFRVGVAPVEASSVAQPGRRVLQSPTSLSFAVASRDDALLAWLESRRTVEHSPDRGDADFAVVSTPSDIRRDWFDSAIDAALEGLAGTL